MVGLGPVDYRVQWVGVVFEWVVCPTLICWVAARAEMRRGMGMGCVLGLRAYRLGQYRWETLTSFQLV